MAPGSFPSLPLGAPVERRFGHLHGLAEAVADRRPGLRNEQVDPFVQQRAVGRRDHEQVGRATERDETDLDALRHLVGEDPIAD